MQTNFRHPDWPIKGQTPLRAGNIFRPFAGWLGLPGRSHFWFCLFVFALPLLTTSPLQKIPLTTISSGWFLTALLSLTAILLAKEIIAGGKIPIRPLPGEIFWLGLFLLLTVITTSWTASFFSPGIGLAQLRNPAGLLGYSYKKLLYCCFVFFFLLASHFILNDLRKIGKAVAAYLIATVLACLYGLYLFLAYYQKWGFLINRHQWRLIRWWAVHPTVPRFIGLAIEPQTFASLLVATLPLNLALYLAADRLKLPAHWLLAGLLLQFVCLFLTFSGGGLIACLAACLCLVLIGRRYWNKRYLATLLATLLVSLAAVFVFLALKAPRFIGNLPAYTGKLLPPQAYSELTRREITSSDVVSSVMERLWLRQAAWSMFLSRPWLGLGQGGFAKNYSLHRPPRSVKYQVPARPHNQYLEVLAETGAIGFAVMFFFFASLLRRTWKGKDSASDLKAVLTIGLLATFSGFAVHGFFFGVFQRAYFWLIVVLLAAVASAPNGPGTAGTS